MIHVLDFDDNIIDFISQKDNYIISGGISRDTVEEADTFDFVVDSDRAYNLRERNRIIVADRNNVYREYIIVNVSDDIDDNTTVQCNASYVEDLTTAKPYAPGGFTKFTTTQALDDITKDTGWETSDETEYGGVRSSTWTSYQTRYEVARQMRTTYDMVLDFSIELSSNSVAHRYVSLKDKHSLFKGKEIVYGKDLLSMTRDVDITELHTALLAIGPEDEEGNRKEVIVTDDDAQLQFGLEKRYIWGVYEPESDDAAMTEERLKTLARTQLNKDKQAAISYEITAADLSKHYSHEEINLGDTVRVKDTEFNPPLYVDAEVISEVYDVISGNSEFTFGNVNEYKASELRKDLYDRINDIQKKMNDNISNVNTIVADVVEGQLEYFERKIIKSDTAPENPVNDMMWYDTSNPEVAVLRRYWNGEWIEQTADDVEKIGGITREKALFNSLTNTFTNLSIQHAKLQSDVYEVVSSEYLVDDDIKAAVNTAYDNTTKVFDNIKGNLDSMTPETATIGKLIDTQALFLTYRERMQTLYKAVENAKRAIDKRFKLLQSQYTDEKFNEAMQNVAASLPNGVWNEDTMQLSSDIPNQQQLEELRTSLQTYTDGNLSDLKDLLTQSIDSKINVAKEEISASVTSLQNEIDGLEIGGRNLLLDSRNKTIFKPNNAGLGITTKNADNSWTITPDIDKAVSGYHFIQYENKNDITSKPLILNDWYTISFEVTADKDTTIEIGINSSGIARPNDKIERYEYYEVKANTKSKIHFTFKWIDKEILVNIPIIIRVAGNNNIGTILTYDYPKLEEGNKPTPWTPAPEDTEAAITKAQQQATDAAKAYADAQDNLKAVETQAYADGIVDEVEQRAIDDATNKMNETKTYAEQKATDAQNAAISESDRLSKEAEQAAKKYADAQDELQQVEVQAYADGVVDAEEQRAIQDATDKMNTAKTYAETKATEAKNAAITDAANKLKPITTRVTTTESNIKVLQDGLKLTATKTEVEQTLNDKLTPIQNQVKEQKATLDVLPNQIASKVSKSDYTTDQNNIVSRLDSADSERVQLSNQISDRVTLKEYTDDKEETDKTLTTMQTSIDQNGKQIALKASTTEMNASKKTLSSVIADLTINTTTGITMSYDENGAISSHTVDKNGVKIRGDKVDIKVNKEFQVLAGNVDDKVGKDEVINRLNLSPEGLDINVNKIGIRGGDKSTRYVDIRNNAIELGGVVATDWRGVKTTDPIFTRLKDGHLRFRNDTKNASLYFSYYGISTYMDGEGESGGSSGTIAWWDPSYSPSGANGITINSYGGVAALTSGVNRTMVQSRASVNLESMRSAVYIRPHKSQVGNSTFAFTSSTGETSNANVKGYLMFGDLTNEDSWKYYSGLRFYKGKSYIEVVDGDFSAGGNTVLDAGNIMANSIFKRNGSTSAYWNGTSGGTIDDGATPLDNQLVATSMVTNRGDKNMYLGTRSGGSLLITNEYGYNSGNGQKYSGVGAASFTNMSLESLKTDIEAWDYDALNVLVNETQIYQYKLKNDVENGGGFNNRGLVIGDGYETPDEFRAGDGINLYEMSSWQLRAIQQLNEKLEEQNKVIKQLEEQINE